MKGFNPAMFRKDMRSKEAPQTFDVRTSQATSFANPLELGDIKDFEPENPKSKFAPQLSRDFDEHAKEEDKFRISDTLNNKIDDMNSRNSEISPTTTMSKEHPLFFAIKFV